MAAGEGCAGFACAGLEHYKGFQAEERADAKAWRWETQKGRKIIAS